MKHMISVMALGLALASPASAEFIHAGSESGSYTGTFCPLVQAALKSEYFDMSCKTSAGTGANINSVLANPKDVALGQLDIVGSQPQSMLDKLAIVDPDMGLECLYAVTADPDISSISEISKRIPMALPSADSGSALTFKKLQSLDENLASLRNIQNMPDAKSAVQSVVDGQAAMAFFVQFPDTDNEVFEIANKNDLTFIPVITRKLLRQEANGIKLYQPSEVSVTSPGWAGKLQGKSGLTVTTTCTKIVVFTGVAETMTGEDAEDQLAKIQAIGRTERPASKKWTDIFGNVKSLTEEAVAKYLQ